VSDISDAARCLASGTGIERTALANAGSVSFRAIGDVRSRFYLRLMLPDKPGVMGTVATVLGQHNISLASVLQKEPHSGGRSVPVIILTHPARERDVEVAIRTLEEMQAIGTKSVRLRVEDLGIEK
jgi:homoserine dehydrogenase